MSRRTRDKYVPKRVQDAEAVIHFILDRHAVGLLVLVGDEPWPTMHEFAEMASYDGRGGEQNTRVQGGESVPEAQRIVERAEYYQRAAEAAGGVDRITAAFRDLRANSQRAWSILRDSSLIRRGRPCVSMGCTARAIARRHFMHEDTMRRNALIIIQNVAFEICYPGFDYMRRGQGMAL